MSPSPPVIPAVLGGADAKSKVHTVKGALTPIVSAVREIRESLSDSDVLTDYWLCLRQAARDFAKDLLEQPISLRCSWQAESQPPSLADLELLKEFSQWALERAGDLSSAYDAIQLSNAFTVFNLRVALCAFGITKESGNVAEDPSKVTYAALCALLRPDNTMVIPEERFCKVTQFLEMERRANEYLVRETGTDLAIMLDVAGARARAIVRLAKTASSVKQASALLVHCSNLLDMEPKATCNVLLIDLNGTAIANLVDMVLRQGCRMVYEHTELVLRVWRLCVKLVQHSASLGKPTPMKTPRQKVGKDNKIIDLPRRSAAILGLYANQPPPNGKTMAQILAEASKTGSTVSKSSSATSLQQASKSSSATRFQQASQSSPATSLKQASKLSTATQQAPHKDTSFKNRIPTKSKKVSRVVPTSANDCSSDSDTCSGDIADSPLRQAASDMSLPPVVHADPEGPVVTRRASTLRRSSSLHDVTLLDVPGEPQGLIVIPRASAPMLRRASTLPDVTLLDVSAACESTSRRSSIMSAGTSELEAIAGLVAPFDPKATDNEWELKCCARFWSVVPAQSVVFVMGIGLQTIVCAADMLRLLRGAWSLLDKTRAVECYAGTIGMSRLRLQLEALAESRILSELKEMDPETSKAVIAKSGQTAAHLSSICRVDVRFAKSAILYGGYFLVERLFWQLEAFCGHDAVELAPFVEVLDVLGPHLKNFLSPGSAGVSV